VVHLEAERFAHIGVLGIFFVFARRGFLAHLLPEDQPRHKECADRRDEGGDGLHQDIRSKHVPGKVDGGGHDRSLRVSGEVEASRCLVDILPP
jgi:hypothetical protein